MDMDWLRNVCEWIVTHWKSIGLLGALGLAGKMIHWWWDYRKKKADALLAEHELKTRSAETVREERIKSYVRFFELDLEKTREKLFKEGNSVGTLGYMSRPQAAPGESQDEVDEAWERFCKKRNGKS